MRPLSISAENDSMDTIKKLSDYAIVKGHSQKFLGVPKTIDNDLALTDHTPGFGSAAKYIATSTKEVIRDAMGLSYKRKMITIMEIMGRNAGWLTGATALAKTEECCGPDLIYLPEVPFDIEKFLKKCTDLLKKKSSIVVAVSEGIKTPDGTYVCQLSGGSDYVTPSDTRSWLGRRPIWRLTWRTKRDIRPGRWNCPLSREARPTWPPGWISTRPLW